MIQVDITGCLDDLAGYSFSNYNQGEFTELSDCHTFSPDRSFTAYIVKAQRPSFGSKEALD